MSKVKIQGNASGTGVVTLTAPNTNTDRTITLPDSTGSILDSTSTLDATKLTGALPAIDGSALTNLSAGKVLQVVSVKKTDTFSTTSSTLTNITGLSASITLAATSKVLVTGSVFAACNYSFGIEITRNGSAITYRGDAAGSRQRIIAQVYASNSTSTGNVVSFSFIDEPSSASEQTYQVRTYAEVGSGGTFVNRNARDADGTVVDGRGASGIVLQEIGA